MATFSERLRRIVYDKRIAPLFLAPICLAMFVLPLPGQEPLQIHFQNNASGFHSDDEVYVSIMRANTGQNFDMTLDGNSVTWGGSDLLSESFTLKQISDGGGFVVNDVTSAAFYISFGQPLGSLTTAPSPVDPSDPSINIPYQNFELTRTGGTGDQGDITAINFFSAPLGITSYSSYGQAGQTQLQSVGYNDTAQVVYHALSDLTNGQAVTGNLNGHPVRVVGPTSYAAPGWGPYNDFSAYLTSVHSEYDQSPNPPATFQVFENNSAFATPGSEPDNYNFIFTLDATMPSATEITLSGSVVVDYTPFGGSTQHAAETFNDINVSMNGLDALTYIIYSGVITNDVVFSGDGWDEFQTYVDGLPDTIKDADPVEILKRQMLGDLATGFSAGFVNSDVTPPGGTVALKDMTSTEWWNMLEVIGFSDAQPDHDDFYHQFGAGDLPIHRQYGVWNALQRPFRPCARFGQQRAIQPRRNRPLGGRLGRRHWHSLQHLPGHSRAFRHFHGPVELGTDTAHEASTPAAPLIVPSQGPQPGETDTPLDDFQPWAPYFSSAWEPAFTPRPCR